jgi:hypothetical protein
MMPWAPKTRANSEKRWPEQPMEIVIDLFSLDGSGSQTWLGTRSIRPGGMIAKLLYHETIIGNS